jgi:hypothetical protein
MSGHMREIASGRSVPEEGSRRRVVGWTTRPDLSPAVRRSSNGIRVCVSANAPIGAGADRPIAPSKSSRYSHSNRKDTSSTRIFRCEALRASTASCCRMLCTATRPLGSTRKSGSVGVLAASSPHVSGYATPRTCWFDEIHQRVKPLLLISERDNTNLSPTACEAGHSVPRHGAAIECRRSAIGTQ